MARSISVASRRLFLSSMSLGTAAAIVGSAMADDLIRTPAQTEGPFYPNKLPLDTDNDLVRINEGTATDLGEITHLTGRIVDAKGNPVRNAIVEIWQVDQNGAYIHTQSANREKRDNNFQGFGRFLTGSTGEYYFRTIKPVPYSDGPVRRTSHIHFMVKRGGKELLTTQCYVRGESKNAEDGILRGIRDPKARESVIVDFAPIKESRIGELAAKFDIVLGLTPEM